MHLSLNKIQIYIESYKLGKADFVTSFSSLKACLLNSYSELSSYKTDLYINGKWQCKQKDWNEFLVWIDKNY